MVLNSTNIVVNMQDYFLTSPDKKFHALLCHLYNKLNTNINNISYVTRITNSNWLVDNIFNHIIITRRIM